MEGEFVNFNFEKNTFDRWRRVGSAKELETDEEVARFLLDFYDSHHQLPAEFCTQCSSPLMLHCVRCQVQSPLMTSSAETKFGTVSVTEELRPKTEHPVTRAAEASDMVLEADGSVEDSVNDLVVRVAPKTPGLNTNISGNKPASVDLETPTSQGNSSITEEEMLPKISFSGTKLIVGSKTESEKGGKPYVCEVCGSEFRSLSAFIEHRRKHTGENPYTCSVCKATFRTKQQLDVHMPSHTGIYRYTCTDCGYGCMNVGALQKHMLTHTGEKPFQCDSCDKRFRQSNGLKKHWLQNHSGVRPFKCIDCGDAFAHKFALNDHRKKHSLKQPTERNIICDICGAAFQKPCLLKYHKRSHFNERPYACEKCNASFKYPGNVTKHMKMCGLTGRKEKRFLCSVCGKGFTTQETLLAHTGIHTGNKPYKCDICEAAFVSKKSLMVHIGVTHTGQGSFACEECGKTFVYRSSLTSHKKLHAEKVYQCSHCEAKFSKKADLNQHMLIHADGGFFSCSDCGKQFGQAEALRVHMQSKHSGEKPYECTDCNRAFAYAKSLRKHIQNKHVVQ